MVLKKSNSGFNSGATQKFCNRGAYKKFPNDTHNEADQLSISLHGLPRVFDENNPCDDFGLALEKVYSYLNFPGPGVETFCKSLITSWSNHTTIKTISFPLNKHDFWLVPEKIENLTKEENFLQYDQELPEISVVKLIKTASYLRTHNKETFVLNPKQKKVSKPSTQCKRDRRRVTQNARGLQRRHILTNIRQQNDEEESEQPSPKKIVIELQEKDHVDARTAGCHHWPSKHNKHKGVALNKSKSYVNGKKSRFHRSYNPTEMRMEREDILSEFKNVDDIWFENEDYIDVREDEQDNFDHDHDTINDKLIIYSENYKPKQRDKKLKTKHDNERVNDNQLVNVNPASSQTTFKYPKGSFQFIDKPCDETEGKSTSEDDVVHVGVDDVPEIIRDDYIADASDSNKDMSPISIIQETFESHDTFVWVNLQFPNDIQERMMDSSAQLKPCEFLIQDCTVALGNCFPLVFCVDLQDNDSNLDEGWILVGTSCCDVSSYTDFQWEVTLKCTKPSYLEDDVKHNFFSDLNSNNNNDLYFDDLVRLALTSVHSVSRGFENENIISKPIPNKSKTDVFVSNVSSSYVEVCSTNDAFNKLQQSKNVDVRNSQNHVPSFEKTTKDTLIPNKIIECDICFTSCDKYGHKDSGAIMLLPCNHLFCYQCWQSHIFHHLMNGKTEIKCMQTDCNEVINKAVMNALVPENYLTKLYSQQKENCIDRSPLCKWCPKSKCDKVAILHDQSAHVQQFGCHVVCDCQSSWCFSCQSNPHWPVSCSQAAAYRKLLYKLGDEMPSEVTCTVDLKPCPGCKYPIEKNEGCPHMMCRMCNFSFCWNCLQSTANHRVWECRVDENSTFVTYQLHNDVISNFPLKYFRDAIDMQKRHRAMKTQKVRSWVTALLFVNHKKLKRPFHSFAQLENPEIVKDKAICLVNNSVAFLVDAYSFLEYYYLLFSFALLNKDTEMKQETRFSIQRLADRLLFTASRLEQSMVGKPLRQIVMAEKSCQMFLENGSAMLDRLKSSVMMIQKLSKNVQAESIGELDPNIYYRYK